MMTWPLLPLRETAEVFVASSALAMGALAWLRPPNATEAAAARRTGFWARILPRDPTSGRRWLARTAMVVSAVTAVGLGLWASGRPSLAGRGVSLTWCGLMLLTPLALSLAASALLSRAVRPATTTEAASPGRRAFLEASVLALPLSTVGTSAEGFAGSDAPQRIPIVRMRYPDLHPDLDGLRILHLSDLHLGAGMRSEDLEALLERAAAEKPDLIVLTGDVADDHGELERALAIVHQHRPRLGVLAALGNHEYLHGIQTTRPIYEKSRVPLLVDRGVTLEVGQAKLYVAGVDDPFGKPEGAAKFYLRAVARSIASAPTGSFRVLLSHRPQGFEAAAARGVELTLSGHTHVRAHPPEGAPLGLLPARQESALHDVGLRPLVSVSARLSDRGAHHRARARVSQRSRAQRKPTSKNL
jgi:predicted phosphodiesterase